MAGSCWEIYNWLATGCELNNTQTMILELCLAGIFAIVLTLYVYKKQNIVMREQKKTIENINSVIAKLMSIINQEEAKNSKEILEYKHKTLIALHDMSDLLNYVDESLESYIYILQKPHGKIMLESLIKKNIKKLMSEDIDSLFVTLPNENKHLRFVTNGLFSAYLRHCEYLESSLDTELLGELRKSIRGLSYYLRHDSEQIPHLLQEPAHYLVKTRNELKITRSRLDRIISGL